MDFVSTHQYAGEPFIGIDDKGGPDGLEEINKSEESTGDLEAIKEKMKLVGQLFESLPEESAKQPVNVSMELKEEPKSVILQRIEEEHCNPLKVWEEAGSPQDMTKAEINELIEKTKVRDESIAYQYEDGRISLGVEL